MIAEALGLGPSPTIPASLSFNLAGKSLRTPGVQHTFGLSEFSLFSASAVQISSVFLPPIIFLSTFHTGWRRVRRRILSRSLYTTVGVPVPHVGSRSQTNSEATLSIPINS